MLAVYSLLFSVAFILLLPVLFWRRQKYAAGMRQRLGDLPPFEHDGREVIWLHCVSVGETNAARPLVDELLRNFPDHRLVVSTTTRTGQELAQNVFREKADAVFYFPFDWKFSVRRALKSFRPQLVLLMETEIWPRFFREVDRIGAKLVIVNGRLSEKSFRNYSLVRRFVAGILGMLDLALMQGAADSKRLAGLGFDPEKIVVTGNIKFDQNADPHDAGLSQVLSDRFAISPERPLLVAASTHAPEERIVLEAFREIMQKPGGVRLLLAPRHPERFDEVAEMIGSLGFAFARRSDPSSSSDATADVIFLDSIGELRAVYPLADVVFVGGSLIPHGGQSILEPAVEGKAVITGPFTANFRAAVEEFLRNDALIQLPETEGERETVRELSSALEKVLTNLPLREKLGQNALQVMEENRGAVLRTVQALTPLILVPHVEHDPPVAE